MMQCNRNLKYMYVVPPKFKKYEVHPRTSREGPKGGVEVYVVRSKKFPA